MQIKCIENQSKPKLQRLHKLDDLTFTAYIYVSTLKVEIIF